MADDDLTRRARWGAVLDASVVATSVVGAVVLVATDAVEGWALRVDALVGERIDEVYLGLLLVLVSTVGAWFHRYHAARREADALGAAMVRLRAEDRWRSDLMATLAHDVRAPLATIDATLQTLEQHTERLDVARRRRLIAAALHQTRRMTALADDLLDLERARAGDLRLDARCVLLRPLVERTLDVVPDVQVEVDVPDGLAAVVDPRRVEQVLVNLLTNAVRHGEPPVVVTARDRGDHVQLEVRDHGPGLPAGLRTEVRRFEASATPGSVGLGLWISQQLVAAHGGRISYEDAGPGARVLVTLPTDGADAVAPAPAADSEG